MSRLTDRCGACTALVVRHPLLCTNHQVVQKFFSPWNHCSVVLRAPEILTLSLLMAHVTLLSVCGWRAYFPTELLSKTLTVVRGIGDSSARARVLSELAPRLPVKLLSKALTVARTIENSSARARVLGGLAPQLSGNLLQQGFEELLDVLPRCGRDVSLFAVSSFFPFLEEMQGSKGLEDARRAIVDTACGFP